MATTTSIQASGQTSMQKQQVIVAAILLSTIICLALMLHQEREMNKIYHARYMELIRAQYLTYCTKTNTPHAPH